MLTCVEGGNPFTGKNRLKSWLVDRVTSVSGILADTRMLLYLMFNPNGIKLIHTLLLDSPSYTFPFTHQQALIALLHDSVIF